MRGHLDKLTAAIDAASADAADITTFSHDKIVKITNAVNNAHKVILAHYDLLKGGAAEHPELGDLEAAFHKAEAKEKKLIDLLLTKAFGLTDETAKQDATKIALEVAKDAMYSNGLHFVAATKIVYSNTIDPTTTIPYLETAIKHRLLKVTVEDEYDVVTDEMLNQAITEADTFKESYHPGVQPDFSEALIAAKAMQKAKATGQSQSASDQNPETIANSLTEASKQADNPTLEQRFEVLTKLDVAISEAHTFCDSNAANASFRKSSCLRDAEEKETMLIKALLIEAMKSGIAFRQENVEKACDAATKAQCLKNKEFETATEFSTIVKSLKAKVRQARKSRGPQPLDAKLDALKEFDNVIIKAHTFSDNNAELNFRSNPSLTAAEEREKTLANELITEAMDKNELQCVQDALAHAKKALYDDSDLLRKAQQWVIDYESDDPPPGDASMGDLPSSGTADETDGDGGAMRSSAVIDFTRCIRNHAKKMASKQEAFDELANVLRAGSRSAVPLDLTTFSSRIKSYTAKNLSPHRLEDATIEVIFKAIDVDDSNTVTLPEITCAFATFFDFTAEDAPVLMFDACDGVANGGRADNFLQQEEFTLAFRSIIAVHKLIQSDTAAHIDAKEVGDATVTTMCVTYNSLIFSLRIHSL